MTDLYIFVTSDAQIVDGLTKVFRLRQIVNLKQKRTQQLIWNHATFLKCFLMPFATLAEEYIDGNRGESS